MSVLHLEILLHYSSMAIDFDQVKTNKTRKQYAYELAKDGLLYTPSDNQQLFAITVYGRKVVAKILKHFAEID